MGVRSSAMVCAEVRRTAITDIPTELVEVIAQQVSQVALDRYAEGFADGSEYAGNQMAASVERTLATAADTNEAYRIQLEKVQMMLNSLTTFNMEDEDTITKGRMLVMETLHFAFSQVMEGEGTTDNEAPNILLYTPAQIVYSNSFLSMIALHTARIVTEDPDQARQLILDAMEKADEVMVTTEKLELDLDRDKLNPSSPSA